MAKRMLTALAAALGAATLAGSAQALTVPFTEDFTVDAEGWLDNESAALTWVATGGPDGGSHVTATFNYFEYANPFSGPVVFRANDADDASGDAFVGDWVAGGVQEASAFVYHETGGDLTFFLRVASPANFPGATFVSPLPAPSGVWTRVSWYISGDSPLCFDEGTPCATVLGNVGNLQIGTDAPAALVLLDQAFTIGVDKVSVSTVPEPGQPVLAAIALLALGALGRRRTA